MITISAFLTCLKEPIYSDLELGQSGQFYQNNSMIILTVITLSGGHCNYNIKVLGFNNFVLFRFKQFCNT
jgi:hypothetical protein